VSERGLGQRLFNLGLHQLQPVLVHQVSLGDGDGAAIHAE
jgi:hypothetical protein